MPTLARMAAPNILVMAVQTSVGLIEAYFVSTLGTDALVGMALVFPVVMLVRMLSAGGAAAAPEIVTPATACRVIDVRGAHGAVRGSLNDARDHPAGLPVRQGTSKDRSDLSFNMINIIYFAHAAGCPS